MKEGMFIAYILNVNYATMVGCIKGRGQALVIDKGTLLYDLGCVILKSGSIHDETGIIL